MWTVIKSGLTRRELFAAMALQGLLARPGYATGLPPYRVAKDALEYADALLRELADQEGHEAEGIDS